MTGRRPILTFYILTQFVELMHWTEFTDDKSSSWWLKGWLKCLLQCQHYILNLSGNIHLISTVQCQLIEQNFLLCNPFPCLSYTLKLDLWIQELIWIFLLNFHIQQNVTCLKQHFLHITVVDNGIFIPTGFRYFLNIMLAHKPVYS